MIKEINYVTTDKSLHIKLVYIVKGKQRNYYVGKTYPEHTQCLMYVNGLLESFSTVVKHVNDEPNQLFAHRISTGRAIKGLSRGLRKAIWNKFNDIVEEKKLQLKMAQ